MQHILVNQQNKCPSAVRLSKRGKEVFELVLEGFTQKQIAERLGISRSGVRSHEKAMLDRNKCASMRELVAKYHGKNEADDDRENA